MPPTLASATTIDPSLLVRLIAVAPAMAIEDGSIVVWEV